MGILKKKNALQQRLTMLFLAFLPFGVAGLLGSGKKPSKWANALEELRAVNRLPRAQKTAKQFKLNLPKGFSEVSEMMEPASTRYTLTGTLQEATWENIFDMEDKYKINKVYVVGVKDVFTKDCKVEALGLAKKDKKDPKAPVELNVQRHTWEIAYDEIHLVYYSKEGGRFYVTDRLSRIVLPFWDPNAMLFPVVFTILGVLLWIAVVLYLCCGTEEEVWHSVEAQVIRDLEAGKLIRRSRISFARKLPKLPVRRIKHVESSPASALDVQNASKMLRSMENIRGRVRTLSNAPPQQPKMQFNGELGQVMLAI